MASILYESNVSALNRGISHSTLLDKEMELGKSHGWRNLVGCSPWGHWKLDATERLHFHFSLSCIGEGNGNPLQCSCLENPRDWGAWWAAVYGVAQSQTQVKQLSSRRNAKYREVNHESRLSPERRINHSKVSGTYNWNKQNTSAKERSREAAQGCMRLNMTVHQEKVTCQRREE